MSNDKDFIQTLSVAQVRVPNPTCNRGGAVCLSYKRTAESRRPFQLFSRRQLCISKAWMAVRKITKLTVTYDVMLATFFMHGRRNLSGSGSRSADVWRTEPI